MLLFPQHFPYTDPLRVLICGGSTPGPGTFAFLSITVCKTDYRSYAASVSDNCVSIAPEAPNATWTIERMVWYFSF